MILFGIDSIMKLMKLFKNLVFVLFISLALLGCANQASLSGGPKDSVPPILDTLKSTLNYQTNFYPEKISLYFNEWINLKNKNQILISPPLGKRPKISHHGKHVNLVFDEEDTLKQNTTYSINFGKSIVDFTEGNPVPNFVFIFATGDKIDSLEIRGKVVNAYDKTPEKNVSVLLYDSERDSVVVDSKPYYFSNTDKNGNFKISHLKSGSFKLFALKDGNSNYLYDLETEKIGFVDTMIIIKEDSIRKNYIIEMFEPALSLKIEEKAIAGFGKIRIDYNRKPDSIRIIESSVKILKEEILNDSLILWYDNVENPDSINLILKNEVDIDTLLLKIRKPFEEPISLIVIEKNKNVKIHPQKQLKIELNQPFVFEDTSKIVLFETIIKKQEDSIKTEVQDTNKLIVNDTIIKNIEYLVEIDSINGRVLNLIGKWKENKKYNLQILPGSFNSLYGFKNDTFEMAVTIDKKENFSNLVCHLDSLNPTMSYIVLLKQQKNIIEERIVEYVEKKDLNYLGLKPGQYSLEIVEDVIKNGRWDGGDYYKKLHAEKIHSFKLSELKANWDQEEDISLKQKEHLKNDTKK